MLGSMMPRMLVFLFFLLFPAFSCHARIQADMLPVVLLKVEKGYGYFDKGTWKIGEKPDEAAIRELAREKGGLRLFAVDGTGVLYLGDGTEVGERAGCYTLDNLDALLLERKKKKDREKLLEREVFFGEIES